MLSGPSPYLDRIVEWLNGYSPELWNNLSIVPDLPAPAPDEIVSGFLEYACKSQHVANITLGRQGLASLPTQWTIDRIGNIADKTCNLTCEWEYRRLLEVYELLDRELLSQLVARGLDSANPEIVDAARDYENTS